VYEIKKIRFTRATTSLEQSDLYQLSTNSIKVGLLKATGL